MKEALSDEVSELSLSTAESKEDVSEAESDGESNATEEDAVSRADNGRGASNEGGEGGDDDGEEEDSAEGDEEYDEDFMDGPAEWADVDEAELQEAVIRLCSLRATSSTSEPSATRMMLPAGENDYLDPMGIGRIDTRAMSLASAGRKATRQTQRRRRKGEPDALEGGVRERQHSDRAKIIPTSDKFDPEVYLSLVHMDTTLDDLRKGISNLERHIAERNSHLQDLVKDNFERFIGCKNSIDTVHARLRASEDPTNPGSVSTTELRQRVSQIKKEAHSAFDSLVERHQQVERMRNVAGLLRRFNIMFSLPSRIRHHVEAQDYDSVISEYRKARQMVGATKMSIWGSLMKEIDKLVEKAVDDLIMRLVTPTTSPEDAVEAVKNLLQLREEGAPGTSGGRLEDPVEIYMSTQKSHFLEKLEEMVIDNSCKMTNLREKMQEKASDDAKWLELQKAESRMSKADDIESSVNRGPSDLFSAIYDDGAELWDTVEVEGVSLAESQAALVKFEVRLTAMMVRQLAEFWLAFSGRRERSRPEVAREIERKAVGLADVVKEVSRKHGEAMNQLLSDMDIGRSASMPGLMLVLRHMAQACRRMEFEGVAPLLSHMSDMGWAAVQHCVTQLCGQLHCSSAWLVEQETFKPMTLSCYTERDPISPLPVALGTCLATATDQLAAIAHEAAAFLPSASSKVQLSREQQVEQLLSEAFYGCAGNCCDALHKLASRLCSGSSSESSGMSNKEHAEGEEAPRMLLLRNNAAFVRGQLLPSSTAAFLGLLQALQPCTMRAGLEGSQRSKAIKGPCFLAPESEAFQSSRQELRRLSEDFLTSYCIMKESGLSEVVDRYLSGLDKGQAQVVPPPRGLREVTSEVVDALAAVHSEVLVAAPSQVSKVVARLAAKVVSNICQLISGLEGQLCHEAAVQLVLELRFLEETVGKPAQVTGQVFEKALAATKKKVDAAHGDWEAVLKDSSRILPSCMRWAAFNTACFKTLALDQP